MPAHDELLRRVIAAPDDDTPRLAYADWAEDAGDVQRAEFIRLQCRLARMSAADPQFAELQQREAELLAQFAGLWALELGNSVSQWAYRRGFVDAVEMCLETSRDEIVALLQKAPIKRLRDISQFCDLQGVVDALPDLAGLEGLELWGLYGFDDQLLDTLLQSPHLANLKTLILHHDRNGNTADDGVLVRGLLSPHRRRIEELAVNVDSMWRGPSCAVLGAIAGSLHLRNLKKLDLTNAGDTGNQPCLDLPTIRALATSPNLANLQHVDLRMTSFPIEVWNEVLLSPWLPKLQFLRMNYARQVKPGSHMTVAEIVNLRDYRAAFERAGPQIDWQTQFFAPWEGNASWQGFSWKEMKEQHLFSMWPQIQQRDYPQLEAGFRRECVQHAGPAAAQAIDELPFADYEQQLADVWRQVVARAPQVREANSICLRVRMSREWRGNFDLGQMNLSPNFSPQSEYSHHTPAEQIPAPAFPAAAELHSAALARQGRLDPGGVEHYLLARTIAAFGRVLQRQPAPLPAFFSCVEALFRM